MAIFIAIYKNDKLAIKTMRCKDLQGQHHLESKRVKWLFQYKCLKV